MFSIMRLHLSFMLRFLADCIFLSMFTNDNNQEYKQLRQWINTCEQKKYIYIQFQMEQTINSQQKHELNTHMSQSSDQASSQLEQRSKRMVNGHLVAREFNRFIGIEKSYCIVLGMQIFLTVIYVITILLQYELDYLGNHEKSNIILCFLNLLTVPSIFLAILSYISYNDLKVSQLKELETNSISSIIFSAFIILLQPYRPIQDVYIQNYDASQNNVNDFKLNYALVLGSLLKFFLFIPCILNLHKFKNPRSSRVCKIYGCPNSDLYTIKCCFKQSPISLIACTFLLCLLIFSFAFRVSERNQTNNGLKFQSYFNSVWLVIITMSSVGYGDLSPKTTVGKIVGFLCTFCGALTVSIMVVVVINTFQLDQNQNKSLRILKKLEQKKQIKTIAAKYIRISLWRVWNNYVRRTMDRYCQQQQQGREQKILRAHFKQKVRISKFTDASPNDIGLEMSGQFESVKFAIQNLHQNTDQILNYLSNRYFMNLEDIKDEPKS